MFEDKTQVIIFGMRENKWDIELWKLSEEVVNFEKLLKRHKESEVINPVLKRKLQDYKIWLEDKIDTTRYWNELNSYKPVNFIYLPVNDLEDTTSWTWYNMDEYIPFPDYKVQNITEINIAEILNELNNENFTKFKNFTYNLEQTGHSNCTVIANSKLYTFIAWRNNETIRFQVWSYKHEPLFDCKNGMNLELDTEISSNNFIKKI